jgi:hypothetical protein
MLRRRWSLTDDDEHSGTDNSRRETSSWHGSNGVVAMVLRRLTGVDVHLWTTSSTHVQRRWLIVNAVTLQFRSTDREQDVTRLAVWIGTSTVEPRTRHHGNARVGGRKSVVTRSTGGSRYETVVTNIAHGSSVVSNTSAQYLNTLQIPEVSKLFKCSIRIKKYRKSIQTLFNEFRGILDSRYNSCVKYRLISGDRHLASPMQLYK